MGHAIGSSRWASAVVHPLRFFSCKAILFVSFLVFASNFASARQIFSTASGDWSTAGTWVGGVVPVANDTVIIQNAHSVSVSGNLYSNSTHMFLVILGTLDLTNNGKLSFDATSKIIIEAAARLLGNNNADQISIGVSGSEYTGSQGTITGPAYVSDGHTPASGEGTGGCNCYTPLSDCVITSSTGYKVRINIWATQVVANTPCAGGGYQYYVKVSYIISFSGTNIPANLWTLQALVYCGTTSLSVNLPTNGGSGSLNTQNAFVAGRTDCATVTPQALNCLNAQITIQGPGISTQTCSTSLPIKLLNFDAVSVPSGAQVRWLTTMENNFDYFELERASEDLNFTPIAKLKGKGGLDVTKSYDFLDRHVNSGKNYYRLKSVDLDGTFEYSDVIFFYWGTGSGIKLYPNPLVDREFTLDLDDKVSTPSEIVLFDRVGNPVFQSDVLQSSNKVRLPSSIPSGFYLLKLSGHNEIIKVVVP